jgi:hypothetical protein
LPLISKIMPDTSTTKKSGQAGAWLMTADNSLLINGGIYSYDSKPSSRVWEKVLDPAVGGSVVNESLEILGLEPDILETISQAAAGNSNELSI